MGETIFITTAIDYTNGPPHIGHAYEKVLVDVIARYHRLKGDDVFFLTGVDQHGQKVQQSAEKAGLSPQQFVDEMTAKFVALWKKLEVEYDAWAATTDERHKRCVRRILQRLWDDHGADGKSRWIYKTRQGGWYSIRQEQFLTEKERGPDGEFGPEWGEVEFREEENYYFRLSEYKQWLLDLIDERSRRGRPLVVPDFRVGELRNAVEKLSGDLCISRPKVRLAWGIEFPFDPDFVTYVWFDALVNYLSFAPAYDPGLRRPSEPFLRWWRSAVHVIGKDILIPAHGVYWPVMLKALGFADDEIPRLLAHGWWNSAGGKMSKSLGNVVDPDALADKYGVEALRYYLVSGIGAGKDANFEEDLLVQRYNADLANTLGNLLNRTLNMAHKYRGGELRNNDVSSLAEDEDAKELRRFAEREVPETVRDFREHLDRFALDEAISDPLQLAFLCNALIEQTAPWKLAKSPEDNHKLDVVLYVLAEMLRVIAILIWPVLPKAAEAMFDQLQWKMDETGKESRFMLSDAVWGGLPLGHVLGKPTPLFPRIETSSLQS